jgi:3-oxoacyl-[acyl-carrier-protein] synthase-3
MVEVRYLGVGHLGGHGAAHGATRTPSVATSPFPGRWLRAGISFHSLKNRELAVQLGVDPEWIRARCGVHSRFVSGPGETTTTLGVRAARQALSNAPSFRPDCLVCATFTPDYPLCPCGPAIAHALELGPIPAFDLNAACSGGVLGLITALSFIAAGTAERVLLIASDTVTHHLADDDAHTRILFGDGAAAFLIEACPRASRYAPG